MSRSRPRILYICPAWPHDKTYGGQLRALHVGRALKQIGDVRLVVVNAAPETPDAIERTSAEFDLAATIKGASPLTRGLRDRLDWALNPRCENVHGCLASPAEMDRLEALLAESDLVWFLKLRSANLLNRWHWPRSVMDIDDLPSVFAQAQRQAAPAISERLHATLHSWIYRRREKLLLERFGVLAVCSAQDRQRLGFSDRVHIIPNGFARPAHTPQPKLHFPPRLGFMGLYSYLPNFDGVRWFVDNCWPLVKRELPDARLRLVGAESDGPLKPADASVDGLGWVADPAAEIATWSAMIVPIHTGAGTRIKIADAFSRRCPVVSTRFGAYGYDVEHGKQLLLADDPFAFAQACIRLIRDSRYARRIADTAWDDFLHRWTWDAIAPSIHDAAYDCLRRSATRSSSVHSFS
ncbi:MAG: glycosyltransferase family 4 protein [Verrucomicrobiota bacterium]